VEAIFDDSFLSLRGWCFVFYPAFGASQEGMGTPFGTNCESLIAMPKLEYSITLNW